MREIALAVVVAAAALAAPVSAQIYDHNTHLPGTNHSMLAYSNPADGAVLDEAPQTLTLTFQHAVTLQRLSITDAHGVVTQLTFEREPHRRTYSIAVPALADGAYRLSFTATGTGGTDTMPGEIRFTVR
ncbi:MAG: copper resistance protein CopC [Hyphomonadaceae bacterium]|nr:copper resistance protein CopC [Hyphomonadaceae bacterium]